MLLQAPCPHTLSEVSWLDANDRGHAQNKDGNLVLGLTHCTLFKTCGMSVPLLMLLSECVSHSKRSWKMLWRDMNMRALQTNGDHGDSCAHCWRLAQAMCPPPKAPQVCPTLPAQQDLTLAPSMRHATESRYKQTLVRTTAWKTESDACAHCLPHEGDARCDVCPRFDAQRSFSEAY